MRSLLLALGALVCFSLLALLTAPFTAIGATPASGTLSPANPSITITSPRYTTSNGTYDPPTCSAAADEQCDDFELTIDLPANYAAEHPAGSIVITTTWSSAAEDFDLHLRTGGAYVHELEGANTGPSPEIIAIALSEIPGGGGTPVSYTIRVVPYQVFGLMPEDGIATTTVQLIEGSTGATCGPSGATNNGSARVSSGVARDLRTLPADRSYGAFVHFSMGSPAQHRELLGRLNLTIAGDYEKYASAVFAVGPVAAFRTLRTNPSVSYIEENKRLRYLGETGSWATRVRVAQEAVAGGPYSAAGGAALDGTGVTVAVVDSGLDARHPDFQGRVTHNYKILCSTPGLISTQTGQCFGDSIEPGTGLVFVDVGQNATTDTSSGHGTHVAGIVAGDGTASTGDYPVAEAAPAIKGTFAGAAPGTSLVAYGTGEAIAVFYATEAFNHILQNYDTFVPRVRVVTNSWGDAAGSTYDAGSVHSCLTRALVQRGVSITYAASNDGGDGSADMTSSYCKDPTPGVICVANYDDLESGRVDGPLNASSSRGKKGDPANYPDIAAPGTNTTSPCFQPEPGQAVCGTGAETRWQPWYGTISGTSMATPHVAGALAMLYQAKPDLTPAQAEDLIQDSARKVRLNADYVEDPQNPGSTIHFGYGAGLLDIQAALDALNVPRAGLPADGAEAIVLDGDNDPLVTGAADAVKLVAQEYTESSGVHGVEYRLTLRDIAAFGSSSALSYRVAQNVNGRHYETTVNATADGLTLPEPGAGNTAPASSAGRLGNVLTLRVPYSALGYPPYAAPIHNIAVHVSDAGGVLDFAPSPANSLGVQADTHPAYGRALTVTQPMPPPDVTESVCIIPGKTKIIDDPGDQVQTPPGLDAPYDLTAVQIAEPGEGPLANKIVFTVKVRNFEGGVVPSGTRWALRFNGPNPPPAGQDDFFIMMTTEEGATPTFRYGTTGVTSDPSGTAGARTFQIEGDLEEGSQFFEDGRIQLVLARDNPLIGPLSPGDTLIKLFLAIRAPATPNNNAIYDQGEEFEHTLIDPATCLHPLPVAALTADVTSGAPPLTVTFDASGSTGDGGIANYTFDFGDDNGPLTQEQPTAVHTYATGGNYTASVVVRDATGLASTNAAQVLIKVHAPPIANAGTDATVDESVAHALNGTGSSDPNGDALTFAWEQLSGPAVSLTDATTPVPSFTAPDVCADDQLVFRLTVTDATGLSGIDEVTVLINNLNVAPVANAGADFSVKEQGAVLLSAAASTDADCEGLDYSWTQTAGPTVALQGADTAMASFAAPAVDGPTVLTFRVTVQDPAGETSFDDITVTVEDDPVIGDNAVGGLSWLTLVALGLGGLARRRRRQGKL